MSIAMNSLCVECRTGKDFALARALGDDATATAFAKDHLELFLQMGPEESSAYFGARIEELFQKHYGLTQDRYREEKDLSNRFVMERLEKIRSRILSAEDPVYAGLQFAVLGNYIDFSALQGEVSFEELDKMLDTAREISLDLETYRKLCADLQKGKRLLYITDNAGEIGFDRLCAEELQKVFPHLEITFCVRGTAISNDATREDAEAVGVPFPVIDNGTAIGGTVLRLLGEEAKQALEKADVVIAKGMGNTESLYGCGYNIYYVFLIKCARFIQFFGKEKMTPMLLQEPRK